MLWLVVTGSREVKDTPGNRSVVGAELVEASTDTEETCLIVGDARGLDALALDLWQSAGNPNRGNYRMFRADWDRHGRRAGIIRNREMIQFAHDQAATKRVLAFFQTGAENKGTAHCANASRRAGFPVKEIWLK